MDAKRDLQIAKDLKVGSLSRGSKIARLYKRNNSAWVTLQPGTELRPVSFNKRQQNEETFFQKHAFMARVYVCFPVFQTGNNQFLFSRCKLCLCYTAGNFNENPSMRARASEHSSNFCEQFEQRPNFASTFKLDGTIRYP